MPTLKRQCIDHPNVYMFMVLVADCHLEWCSKCCFLQSFEVPHFEPRVLFREHPLRMTCGSMCDFLLYMCVLSMSLVNHSTKGIRCSTRHWIYTNRYEMIWIYHAIDSLMTVSWYSPHFCPKETSHRCALFHSDARLSSLKVTMLKRRSGYKDNNLSI